MKQARSSKQREREFLAARKTDPEGKRSESGSDTDRPAKPQADKATRRRYLREYRKWLWPYRWSLLTILLIALVTTGLDMIWPLAIKRIMDGPLADTTAAHAAHAAQAERIQELLRIGGVIVLVLI